MKQHTIKHPVSMAGVGLHSGKPVSMHLKPAVADSGIVFRRADLPGEPTLRITVEDIQQEPMCTALVKGSFRVATIEHLMAALAALAIDNIELVLDAPEVPIMDGSSAPFVFLLQSAGVMPQSMGRSLLKIKKPVTVTHDGRSATLSPAAELSLDIHFEFGHPVVDKTCQDISFVFNSAAFIKLFSRARTFGKAADLDMLHKSKLALGASLENAVGIGDDEVLNPEGLRFKDEFIRHKVLDAVGDLYVAGPILGHFEATNPGHALNNALLREVLADSANYEWV